VWITKNPANIMAFLSGDLLAAYGTDSAGNIREERESERLKRAKIG
jgi:hypothetical protein